MTTTTDYWQEECDFSLLKRYECAHCKGDDDSDIIPDHEYEVTATFPSQFGGYCNIEEGHRFRKGDRVAKLRRADNPMVNVPGVACPICVLDLPRARA